MNWKEEIKAGQIYKVRRAHINYLDNITVKENDIAFVIDIESIAGNVYYIVDDRKSRMDATSFLTLYERIIT
jgi:hypothetical protein